MDNNDVKKEYVQDVPTVPDVEPVKDDGTDLIGDLVSLLDGIEGAPDRDTIMAWKERYGDIFVLPVSDSDYYIYRKITRKEYREVQTLPNVIRKANPEIDDASLMESIEDELCAKAVLFPANIGEKLANSGGLAKTLTEQIYIASCLLPPEIAAQIVIKI